MNLIIANLTSIVSFGEPTQVFILHSLLALFLTLASAIRLIIYIFVCDNLFNWFGEQILP